MRSLCICVLILGIAILPIKGGEGCRMIVSDGNMSCYAEKIANLKLIHDFVTQNTKFAKGVSAPFAGCIGEDLVIAGGCNFPEIRCYPGEKSENFLSLWLMVFLSLLPMVLFVWVV